MTKQRAVILDVLRSDKCHHTADEVFALAKERMPEISRATVYNNLKALEEARLIRRITGEGKSSRYDSSFIPHGHLFCSECGRVWDFSTEGLLDILESAVGRSFDSFELKVRTVCDECISKSAEA